MEQGNKERSYHAMQRNKRIVRYVVLIFLSILCIFPFYILAVNASHTSGEITSGLFTGSTAAQKLKTIWFGTNFGENWKNALNDSTLPVASAMLNSLIIAALILS